MLHQVGHPPQDASDIAKQIVRLAGHSASPHSTALVLNVSPSTVSITPQMTCFRGVKVCRKWLQGKVTINSYSLTTS